MAKCLLFEEGLPKHFWVEAVNTLVYLLNLLPIKALKGITPYEISYWSKPSINHARTFGCVCYAYMLEVKKDKLEKAEARIFFFFFKV